MHPSFTAGLQTARLFFLPLLAVPNHVLVQVSFGKLTTISFTQTKDSESLNNSPHDFRQLNYLVTSR